MEEREESWVRVLPFTEDCVLGPALNGNWVSALGRAALRLVLSHTHSKNVKLTCVTPQSRGVFRNLRLP